MSLKSLTKNPALISSDTSGWGVDGENVNVLMSAAAVLSVVESGVKGNGRGNMSCKKTSYIILWWLGFKCR
jgi:hypothetical protein